MLVLTLSLPLNGSATFVQHHQSTPIARSKSFERLRRFQNLLRTCSNQVVLRQVHPTNRTGGINQEFSRPGNVLSVYTCARVNQIVLPDYLGFRIREKGERIAGLLAKVARYFWSVDAYGNRANARIFQLN